MWVASDLADWWDQQHKISEKALDKFVDDNPNLFAVVAATLLSTAMQVGAGTVDVLRFGEGMAEGGLVGFGKDALRAVSIAGAVGKGAKLVQSFGGAQAARLIKDAPGGVCGWVSITKALRQTASKMYISVSDLLGESAMQAELPIGASSMAQRVKLLRALGTDVVDTFKVPEDMAGIRSLVRRDGSVVMFGVKWQKAGKEVAHALYAFYDHLGRFRIADRSGVVVSSLEELQQLKPGYGAIGSAVPQSVALLKNAFMKFVGPKGLATLATEVQAVVRYDPETVAQAFQVRQQAVGSGVAPLGIKLVGPDAGKQYHTVVSGDWLSKLAKHYYGNWRKWPVVYEANRQTIGDNPNLIRVGQRFWIPDLPQVSLRRAKAT